MIYVPDGHGGLLEVDRSVGGLVGPWEATRLSMSAPAPSQELVPVQVTAAGQGVTSGLSVSLSPGQEPGGWEPLVVADGGTFVRLGGRTRGSYYVTVRHVSGAVMKAGRVVLT